MCQIRLPVTAKITNKRKTSLRLDFLFKFTPYTTMQVNTVAPPFNVRTVAQNFVLWSVHEIENVLKISKGKYDQERDFVAVLAVSSITSNSRFGYGGSCKIFDWTVGLNGGEQTMITCFDDLATDAEAAHRSENLPISFFVLGKRIRHFLDIYSR